MLAGAAHKRPVKEKTQEFTPVREAVRTHVCLGDDANDGHVQRQRYGQVLLAHADQASVGADDEHDKVGGAGGEAEEGGFEVLLVAGQVDEGNDLGGFVADLVPRELLFAAGRVELVAASPVDIVRRGVKAQDCRTGVFAPLFRGPDFCKNQE